MRRAQLVNSLDKQRVLETIEPSGTPPDHLARLVERLNAAREVRPAAVPPDLVTMNSVVRVLDPETGDEDAYALVYPDDFAKDVEWITVHAALGSELLGRWVGEEIEFRSRRGTQRLLVKGLDYQPEAAGHLHR